MTTPADMLALREAPSPHPFQGERSGSFPNALELNLRAVGEVATNQEMVWKLWSSGMVICGTPLLFSTPAGAVLPAWSVWAGSLSLMSTFSFFAGRITHCNHDLTKALIAERHQLQRDLGFPRFSLVPQENGALRLCAWLFYLLSSAYALVALKSFVSANAPGAAGAQFAALGLGLCVLGFVLQRKSISRYSVPLFQGLAVGTGLLLLLFGGLELAAQRPTLLGWLLGLGGLAALGLILRRSFNEKTANAEPSAVQVPEPSTRSALRRAQPAPLLSDVAGAASGELAALETSELEPVEPALIPTAPVGELGQETEAPDPSAVVPEFETPEPAALQTDRWEGWIVPSNSERPPPNSGIAPALHLRAAERDLVPPAGDATFDPLAELTAQLRDAWQLPRDLTESLPKKPTPIEPLPEFESLGIKLRRQAERSRRP